MSADVDKAKLTEDDISALIKYVGSGGSILIMESIAVNTCDSGYEYVCTPVTDRIKDFFSGAYYESVSVSCLIQEQTKMVSFLHNAAQDRKSEAETPLVFDLGLIDYKKAFDFQKKIVSVKIKHRNISDIILILEHPAVFTLGKRGGRENLVVTEKFLKAKT